MNTESTPSFYVVVHEPGAEHPALPTWANDSTNPAGLAEDYDMALISRQDIAEVPGAYQLLNVLSMAECWNFIYLSESLGYLPDAAVSLPREVRHNDSFTWVTDEQTDQLIWQRMQHLASEKLEIFAHKQPTGLNARFRFYRYGTGDYFKEHGDGAWPGSRVIEKTLVPNAYSDSYSMMTVLLFLNDDFEGGATRFLVNADDLTQPAREGSNVAAVDVRTPAGSVLCFPHGHHPLQCIHSSQPIIKGTKYIIRTDMLFEL
ncbi:MAG: oxidoreductase [Chloroflexota bacterium]